MAKQTINNGESGLSVRNKINSMFTEVYNSAALNWETAKVCSYGDSITAGNIWQPTVLNLLGISNHYLRGVGSSRMGNTNFSVEYPEKMTFYANADGSYADRPIRFGGTTNTAPVGSTEIFANMVTQNRIDTIPLDTDLLLVFAGANDAGQLSVGTLADEESETGSFYGAYKLFLTRIHTRLPNCRVILIGMPFHKTADLVTALNGNYQAFRNAIKEIGYAYGYPYIDLRELCGWNTLNADDYLQDNVHPNADGGVRIGEVIAGRLKTIQPVI